MKLLLLFGFLVQTNAFRVPLPYGTGIPSTSNGQGIFHRIFTWLTDDNPDTVSVVSQNEFLDGFGEFIQDMKEMEEQTALPLPILQALKDSLLKIKKELLSTFYKHRHHLSQRFDFVKHPFFLRM